MVYNRNKNKKEKKNINRIVVGFLTAIIIASPLSTLSVRADNSLDNVDILYADNHTVTESINGEKITTSKTPEKNDSSTMDINTFSFDGTEMKSYVKKSGDSTYSTNSRKYDPRNLGFMTEVEDQQSLGICWTFAGNATLETFLKKSGYGSYNLSEEHMRWWGKGSNYNWDIGDTEGSTNETPVGYYTSWMGPKLERDIPYNGNQTTAQGAKKPVNYDSASILDYQVTGVVNVATDRTSVKSAILKYGAVLTGYYDDKMYLSQDKNSYYLGEKRGQNHSITIVGWDDDYSKDKFTGEKKPSSNGAWLIKNSWGIYNSEGGYMWISYEDANILSYTDNYSISKVQKSKGQKMYQHEYSMSANLRNEKPITTANAFDFTKGEVLQGVMFSTDSQGANYEIYYVPKNGGAYDYDSKVLLKSGRVDHSGYSTIDINNYKLDGKAAIAVRIDNTQNGQKSGIGIEKNVEGYTMYKAKSNPGESYVLLDGSLVDMKTVGGLENSSPVIKAITYKKGVGGENLISGQNRYQTAVEISKKGWTSSENLILVNSKALADALSATPLASLKSAPILITDKDKLNQNIENEIKRLGVKNVTIVGGEGSVSSRVADYLVKKGMNVNRIAGNTRIETSQEIANRVYEMSKKNGNLISSVALVNGHSGLSDAISFSPVAGEKTIPVLLVDKKTKTTINDKFKNINRTYIVGGESSVSKEIEKDTINPIRLSGSNRNNTNASIINYFYKNRNADYAFVAKDGIPQDDSLIDGLAVGAYAARVKSPIVLSHAGLTQKQKEALLAMKIGRVYQVGSGNNEDAAIELIEMIQVKK